MGTDVKLSGEFTIIYGGEVIAYCTDFTLEKNKEIIDITKLGDTWKNKKVDTKDFSVSFNGMITRGDTVTASLWDPATAYSAGNYVVLAGKAWEAQGSTTGDNPTTDDGTNWLETSEWLVGTTYAAGDLVYITSVVAEDRIYKSLQGSNIGNSPLTETAYWERLETNYESLLKELANNDTVVECTIKPSDTTETYYFGDGVLTSLSASISQGDKATFSGSFEGSGQLQGISGYEEVTINASNYYYLSTSDFAGDDTSGYLEVNFYVDGVAGQSRELFSSCDEAYSTRYFRLRHVNNVLIFQCRDAGLSINNQMNLDATLGVGWHIVRITSNGSSYSFTIDGGSSSFTVAAGVDDGKWIGDIGYSSFLRDNIGIGVSRDNGGYDYSDEYLMKYVDYNGTNIWVADDI
jgi:hypothetical protein